MSRGLQIHKRVVMIEYHFNQAVNRVRGQRNSSLANIMMVYDQSIRFTVKILGELQDKVRNETELKTIQDIKTKYYTYQGYILLQLDEEICKKPVDDLKRLSERAQIVNTCQA